MGNINKIDAVFAGMDTPQHPGAGLLVIDQNEIVYKKCYGLADVEAGRPVTADTSFYLGSISKQFTAMAIMLLAEQGRLRFEDRERLADNIRNADGFVFVTGEHNWGVQPGLKNFTDHSSRGGFGGRRIVSYSAGRWAAARSASAWHGTLSEMGMVIVSSTISIGSIGSTLLANADPSEGGHPLGQAFPPFRRRMSWWVERRFS